MSALEKMIRKLNGREHLILLVSLVFTLLVVPLLGESLVARLAFRLGITAVIILAAITTKHRRLLYVGVYALLIATPANWASLISIPYLFLAACVIESLFFTYIALIIVTSVIRKHLATVHSIFGAMSAYLLLGLAWALLYMGISVDAAGGWNIRGLETADGHGEIGIFSRLVYFSFVTMSTLGYGDIVPETQLVRTLAWMQSVAGQFYMAVLVAWIVSEIPRLRPRDGLDRFDQAPMNDQQRAAESQLPGSNPKNGPPENST